LVLTKIVFSYRSFARFPFSKPGGMAMPLSFNMPLRLFTLKAVQSKGRAIEN